jgi:ribosomal-protein-alanine N-acetyltransferase
MLADLDSVHALWTEPSVRRFLFDDQIISRDQAAQELSESSNRFIENGSGLWGAAFRYRTSLIGFCGYRPFFDPPQLQLLYGFHPDYWSNGYATEASRAMIRFGFESLGFDAVVACADAPNKSSLRVMEKSGMMFDRRELVNGLDTVFYRLERRVYKPDAAFYKVSPRSSWNKGEEENT